MGETLERFCGLKKKKKVTGASLDMRVAGHKQTIVAFNTVLDVLLSHTTSATRLIQSAP